MFITAATPTAAAAAAIALNAVVPVTDPDLRSSGAVAVLDEDSHVAAITVPAAAAAAATMVTLAAMDVTSAFATAFFAVTGKCDQSGTTSSEMSASSSKARNSLSQCSQALLPLVIARTPPCSNISGIVTHTCS